MTERQTEPTLLLTPRETAKLLAISERTLFTRTAEGQIPHVKLGRLVRYPRAELESWITAEVQLGRQS